VKATINSIHSPDFQDLEQYDPPNAAFSIFLQLLIGPEAGSGEESFDIDVCSPRWLETQALPMIGRHLLIVERFDFPVIRHFLETTVAQMEDDTWHGLALKLARIGHWEFEDYDPNPHYS
jgi:hypothetical protein